MPNQLYITVALLGSMSLSGVQAATVLTEQNIARYEAALPELAKIEQDNPASLKSLRLAQHCDWTKHANDLRAKEQGKDYLPQVDAVLAKHQLTPALFIELTAKGAWPVLQSMQGVFHLTRQSLPFLPEVQRMQAERTLAQSSHMTAVIEPCLTPADKAALQQYQQRFINLATRLPGFSL